MSHVGVIMAEFINMSTFTSSVSFSEFYNTITPLILYIMGMVIYAIFIFKFYRFIARKDIFKLGLSEYSQGEGFFSRLFAALLYIIEYVLLFPIFSFFWFGVLSLLFILLSKKQEIQYIMLISMTLVAVIRITAYYNEELSKDLAKMLPFALLGVFLIDMSYFSFSSSITILKSIPSVWKVIFYYLLAVIALEFILRATYSIFGRMGRAEEEPQEAMVGEQNGYYGR